MGLRLMEFHGKFLGIPLKYVNSWNFMKFGFDRDLTFRTEFQRFFCPYSHNWQLSQYWPL
jgi:hypothetical protein